MAGALAHVGRGELVKTLPGHRRLNALLHEAASGVVGAGATTCVGDDRPALLDAEAQGLDADSDGEVAAQWPATVADRVDEDLGHAQVAFDAPRDLRVGATDADGVGQ